MAVKTRKLPAPEVLPAANHPMHKYLREDRLPHIWCSGCGLGTALSCFTHALDELGLGPKDVAVVSGIGCTGRVAGYVNLDSYHTTHGRAIPFASGLTVAQPEKKVVVFSGDGDLFAIGGNHFIHAARRNIDMTVICVNNFRVHVRRDRLPLSDELRPAERPRRRARGDALLRTAEHHPSRRRPEGGRSDPRPGDRGREVRGAGSADVPRDV